MPVRAGAGGCQRVCKVGKDCTRSAPLTAAWEGSPAEPGGVARKFPEGKKIPNASIGRQLKDALTGASPSSKTVSFEAGQKVMRFRRKKSEKNKKAKSRRGSGDKPGV